jgi:hypothetical protein
LVVWPIHPTQIVSPGRTRIPLSDRRTAVVFNT